MRSIWPKLSATMGAPVAAPKAASRAILRIGRRGHKDDSLPTRATRKSRKRDAALQKERDRLALYYPNLKIAYSYIAKNACSTLKGSLAAAENGATYQHVPHELDDQFRGQPEAFDDSWTSVIALRDPFDRFVSAYLDKITRPMGDEAYPKLIEEIYRDTGRPPPRGDESVSITEFLQWVKRQDRDNLDIHWRPQSLMVSLPRFDHVLRVETLNEDWAKAGLAARVPLLSFTKHATKTSLAFDADLRHVPGHHIYGFHQTTGQFPPRGCFAHPDLVAEINAFYADDLELIERLGTK